MPGFRVTHSQLKGSEKQNLQKYLCPSCHLLLRDAVQLSCGHWLCQSCAEDLFESESSSPHCPKDDCKETLVQDDGQKYFPDRFVRRTILAIKLYCSNWKHGCRWEGTVDKYEPHLKQPCLYLTETCQCGKEVLSRQLENHKMTDCPSMRKHCPLADLGCLDKNAMTREELHSHFGSAAVANHFELMAAAFRSFKDQCSLNVSKKQHRREGSDSGVEVSSSISYPKLRAFDDETDGKENKKVNDEGKDLDGGELKVAALNPTQQSVLSIANFPEDVSQTKSFKILSEQVMQHMRQEMSQLRDIVELGNKAEIQKRDHEIQNLQKLTGQLQKTIKQKNTEIEDRDFRLSLVENSSFDGTMIWKIPQFSQRMDDAKSGKYTSIFSLPFYSGRYGYKMCLRLYIVGDGIGKNTHMSLFFVVMKGEFDNILPWPFNCRVTFRLISQTSGRDIVDTFQPDPISSSFKKPTSDMNIASGCPLFILHKDLNKGGYVVDNSIFIKCVVDRSSMRHP